MPDTTKPRKIRSGFSSTLIHFESELRRRLVEGVRAGRSMPELEREFATLLRDLTMADDLRREMYRVLRLAQRDTARELKAEFVAQRSLRDKAPIVRLVDTTLKEFTRYHQTIEQKMFDEIRAGIQSGRPRATVAEAIETNIGIEGHRARTIARTGLAGVSRAAHIETAKEAGIDSFRYTGPGAERTFCARHLGHVYTLNEIKELDNGQGLEVLNHCGGYNCRHRWRAVTAK